ncbi:MAG: PD40 domain-containing protein [Chitinophagaceae bacterium]|nr:PD40 domain-containing protein [Anaerolineae bacterium]
MQTQPFFIQELLHLAIKLVKEGKKDEAGAVLVRILKEDKRNAEAWYLTSFTAKTQSERIQGLEHALKINPKYEVAQKRLKKLRANKSVTDTLPKAISAKENRFSIWLILLIVVLIMSTLAFVLLLANLVNRPSSRSVASEAQSTAVPSCPVYVEAALNAIDANCAATGRNQVCYGNFRLLGTARENIANFVFEQPGDITNFDDLQNLSLISNMSDGEWGIALLELQANLPDTFPGQNVTFLLFGDIRIDNSTELTHTDDNVRAFYFRSGIGDAPCSEAPASGILIQTPNGVAMIQMRINNVDIEFNSTIFLQAQPNNEMIVNGIDGNTQVTAMGIKRNIPSGSRTRISLDSSGTASSAPSRPEPYTLVDLSELPLSNLKRKVSIASPLEQAALSQILFVAQTSNQQRQIYLMDGSGENIQRITNYFPSDADNATWVFDGQHLGFVSYTNGIPNVYTIDANGDDIQLFVENAAYPAWSPDGTKFAFASNRDGNLELYMMDLTSSERIIERLTNNPLADTSPSWSPDSAQIAYIVSSGFQDSSAEIYLINSNGSNNRRLTNNDFYDGPVSWSPDSTRMVFSRSSFFTNLVVMNADGTNEQILPTDGFQNNFPDWSPDGNLIAFISNRDGNQEIYIMNPDGSNQQRLTSTSADEFYPVWRP